MDAPAQRRHRGDRWQWPLEHRRSDERGGREKGKKRPAQRTLLCSLVDETKAEAKYTDGVLLVTLPKQGGTAVKEVAVH